MPCNTRRRILVSTVGCLTAIISGCSSIMNDSDAETTEPTNGAPAPWARASSNSDIAVINDGPPEVNVTVEADGISKEITLELSEYWVSENIIDDGEALTITVSTDNDLQKAVDWSAETNNSQVAIFVIRDNRLDAEINQKEEPS